jgi:uncharacterized surface protein with fasciclin (FAS1) repeats
MLTFAFLFYQCTDPHERYDDPPWLGGTNIETLEKEGSYTNFIALMDKAEYRVSIENQMFTLFVPSDSSFKAYFQKIGVNSVDELSKEQAEELFGQHILVNPRSRDQLMYEYAWSELQDPEGEYGTLFHRKKTYSVPIDYREVVRYNETYKDQDLLIRRSNTFVPLWTTEYFEDYFGDPQGSDYLIMYPESSWSGTQWHDAMVTNAEVRTSSGFIYYLDRVVEPIPTIDKYLMDNQDKFGLYYDLAQRFATYSSAGLNEHDERRYTKGYNQLLNIANEAGPQPGDPSNMLYMFSSFIPYDNVLQDFLNNTILKYYTSIDSVPELFLVYLLQSHLNSFLTLPSKMDKRFVNYYGDDIKLDILSDINTSVMCSNGVIYAMNRVLAPNAFTCVPGPVFYNKNYTTFLYALDISGELTSLTQSDIDVTLFAADNDEMLKYGIRAKNDAGAISIETRASDGIWKTMDYQKLIDFVRNYFTKGVINDLSGEGFIRMQSDNYLYYNNGKISGGGNQFIGDNCSVLEKLTSEVNGNLFYLDNAIKKPKTAAEILFSDPDLASFANLLYLAELIDSVQDVHEQTGIKYPRVNFMPSLTQWTVLAPTNQAIAAAQSAGLIPEERDPLREFIYYHFVRGKCVFDDGVFSGTVNTNKTDAIVGSDIVYATLEFTNGVHNLSVRDKSGQVIDISHVDADVLVETGVLHKINTVLKP